MTVTNNTNDASTSLIKNLQTTAASSTSKDTGTSSLGKDSFLQLLVTQMQNQNPLDPQDNSEFVAQLAQFSSLETMQNLSTTVDSISSMYQSNQALQASSLVGRSVTADLGSTAVDTTAGMTGSAVLPSSSTDTTVKVYDSTGAIVRTLDLGAASAGSSSFTWDGKNDSGTTLASGNYSFVASGTLDGTATTLTTYLPATVSSVTMGSSGSDITLNLASGGKVALSSVQQIGI